MAKMKAVVFHAPEDIRVEEVDKPQIVKPTDAIVKVTTSTICGTDLHILHGEYPVKPGLIIGHEFVGVVEQVGAQVTKFKPGDRVAVSCITQCGTCFYCKEGTYAHCVDGGWLFGNVLDGAQAEYVRVPYADMGMHLIPDELEDEDVLFVGDILSTAYFGVENARIKPGDVVAIVGAGPVGLCAIASAKLFGPSRIIAVGRRNFGRLEAARELGADDVVLSANEDPVQKIKELTDGRGADVVIECVGGTSSYETAMSLVRPGGRVSLVGVFSKPVELPLEKLWDKNITLSWGLVNANRIPELIQLIKGKKINLRSLITHTFPLEDALKAYEVFDKKIDNALKVVLKP